MNPDLNASTETSGAPASTRRRGRRFAVGFAVAVGWALCFEVGLRIDDWVRYRTPMLSPYRSQTQLVVRDADGIHGRPHARFRKWVLNNEGMRGPDVRRDKTPGTVRLVAVGASETFGLYEGAGREYPRQLEDSLEAMRRDGRCTCRGVARFEVLNGALPGMSLPTVGQDVRNRIRRVSPDGIVLYPSPAQYLDDESPVAARPDSSARAARAIGLGDRLYPRAIGRLRDQAKLNLPAAVKDFLRRRDAEISRSAHSADWQFRSIPMERLAAYRRDLSDALESIRAAGAQPFVVSHANAFSPTRPRDESQLVAWGKFYPRALPAVILAFDDSAAVITRQVARAQSVGLADWHALARTQPGRLFEDFVHMTDRGAALLAGQLAAEIVRWTDARWSVSSRKPSASVED
ncbi:MAG: hypothetical protein IT355_12750 [Gemmatimonadaceae bacterium]|nr:hypothetical protein [Gemmatimonadaceae bacterium]